MRILLLFPLPPPLRSIELPIPADNGIIISTNISRSAGPFSRVSVDGESRGSRRRNVHRGLILSRTYADRKFIGISCKSARKPALPVHRRARWRWRRLTFNVVGHCRCVLSPLNPSVVRSFPIFNWIFSLAREVIYPFYLRAESRIPIERKLN